MRMSHLRPDLIDNRQLHDQVYEVLRDGILGGRFAPGQRISIREVAKELNVSITPVRDACNRLAMEGLAQVRPRSGVYVTRFTTKDIKEMYQIRLLIEPQAARETALHVSEEWLHDARQLATEIERATGAVPEYQPSAPISEIFEAFRTATELDSRFHLHLVSALENDRLLEFYRNVNVHWRAPHVLFRINYNQRLLHAYQHLPIVEAYEARDPEAAARALTEHLDASMALHMRQLGETTTN